MSQAVVLVAVVTEDDIITADSGRAADLGGSETNSSLQHTGRGNSITKDMMRQTCMDRVGPAADMGFNELQRRHVADMTNLLSRVEFSLEDKGEEVTSHRQLGDDGEAGSRGVCSTAGLPIRERVSRAGQLRAQRAGRDRKADSLKKADGVDDGLVELMYHYGRWEDTWQLIQ